MTIQSEILRLQGSRDKIRAKAVELGLSEGTAKLDEVASSIEGIVDNGSVSASVKEGETYTIPKGYHNGSGTVSGVAGGGNYTLQSKTVTPTKLQQNITSDEGYYGLSDVTVNAIPANYQDISGTTATAADVLATKIFIDSAGKTTAGTMPNNGTISKTLDVETKTYAIPAGYHSGSGNVSINTETKTATPTKSSQNITPTTGKVLENVTVEAIPVEYQDVTSVTATADKVLTGYDIVSSTGQVVNGSMANNGSVSEEIDGLSTTEYIIPKGYHDGTGKVSLTNDILTALEAI